MSSINMKIAQCNKVLLSCSTTQFHPREPLLTLSHRCDYLEEWTTVDLRDCPSFNTQTLTFQEIPQAQATGTTGHPSLQLYSGSWASSMAMADAASGVCCCHIGILPSLSLGFWMLNWKKHTKNRSCLQHSYVKCSSRAVQQHLHVKIPQDS